jgi:conjugative relaxase-like TrwC/TraI family protein
MSGHVLHAGEGYAYLLRTVATSDEHVSAKTGLFDYYESRGTPPGRWFGSGITSLNSETVTEGAIVTESQMAALHGEGLHPDADQMIDNGASLKDVQLGRAFPMYTDNDPVLKKLAEAEKAKRNELGRRLTPDERNTVAVATCMDDYRAATGDHSGSPKRVAAWVTKRKRAVRQPVSGFDFTFSPPKSVSMLWALGDNDMRTAIERIHHEAVNDTLHWFEDNALYTRDSTNSDALRKTTGMIAAQFDHFDSRAGDPDLHTHVAISNKVYDPAASKWKSIDSRSTHRNIVTASSRYNTLLMNRLANQLGVGISTRSMGEGKRPVHEIAGIPTRLIDAGSKRRAAIEIETQRLVDNYYTDHGRTPSTETMYDLAQQATLNVRPEKGKAKTLAELRGGWRDEYAALVGGNEALDHIIAAVAPAASEIASRDVRPILPAPGVDGHQDMLDEVADKAVNIAADRRSHFRTRHLDTAVSDALRDVRTGPGWSIEDAHTAVLDNAKQRAVSLDPQVSWQVPERLTHANGTVIDKTPGNEVYTSRTVMAMEETVHASAARPVAYTVSDADITAAIDRFNHTNEFPVNTGQQAMIRHLAATGVETAAAVGPAGTGKTTSMKVLAGLWRDQGHEVYALSTQRSAAKNLAGEIGATPHTLDALTKPWRGEYDRVPARDTSGLPVNLKPGDMLLVDEAGMASTDNLAAITEIAHSTGAVVRMIGDPAQIAAVGRGGVFGHLCETTNAAELDTVVRMGADTEQAENTLLVRDGDAIGLDLFFDRGWVHAGPRQVMLDQAVADHLTDRAEGFHGIIIAGTNADVHELNARIRAARTAGGEVDATGPQVRLAEASATAGDTLLARRNTRFRDQASGTVVEVDNSDLFRLDMVGPDGSALVRRLDDKGRAGDTLVLPADYLAADCYLGYASTTNRSQGVTVEKARDLTGRSTTRESLYVGTTRASKESHLYVITDKQPGPDLLDAEGQHQHMAGNDPQAEAREILTGVLVNTQAPESAHALRERLASEEFSDERATGLHNTAAGLLSRDWAADQVDNALSYLPTYTAAHIDEQGRDRLTALLAQAVTAGADVETLVPTAFAVDGSERDTVGLISSRLRAGTPTRPEELTDTLDHLPPRFVGEDTELRMFADDIHQRLAATGSPVGDNTVIRDADLRGLDLSGRALTNVTLIDCRVDGLNLDRATLSRVRFTRCTGALSATGTVFGTMAHSTETVLRDCDLTGSDLRDADINRLRVTGGGLDSVDLSDATIVHANITDADVTGLTADNLTVTGNLSIIDTDTTTSDLAGFTADGHSTGTTDDPEDLLDDYTSTAHGLAASFAHSETTTYVNALPTYLGAGEPGSKPDGFDRLVTATTRATEAGIDFRDLWAEATVGLESSDWPMYTLANRITELTDAAGGITRNTPALPPVWDAATSAEQIDYDTALQLADELGINAHGTADEFTAPAEDTPEISTSIDADDPLSTADPVDRAVEDYHDGAHDLAGAFADTELRRYLAGLPVAITVDDQSYYRIVRAAADAAESGVDFREHWLELTAGIDESRFPARDLADRVDTLATTVDTPEHPLLPPRYAGTDTELLAYCRDRADVAGIDTGADNATEPAPDSPTPLSEEDRAEARMWIAKVNRIDGHLDNLTDDETEQLITAAITARDAGVTLNRTVIPAAGMARGALTTDGTPTSRVCDFLTAEIDRIANPVALDPVTDADFLTPDGADITDTPTLGTDIDFHQGDEASWITDDDYGFD